MTCHLIDREKLQAVQAWAALAEGKPLNKREREMLGLLRVLLNSCTPYAGHHGRVESALANFAENMIR